ncbi:MAG: DUF3368 domain-containing protein [Calditrichaeota bacterium]|nr:DUF3368 domain-containing protein [Calditrichota bacterium]
MPKAICNTSPLLYLYRINAIEWLPKLFDEICTTNATVSELENGREKGFDVPIPYEYDWLKVINPKNLPSEWLSLDLGVGELYALALALENKDFIILLDDLLARRTAKAAGLTVWGTLRVILEAKEKRIINKVKPSVLRLKEGGLWFSDDIFKRILRLADEE